MKREAGESLVEVIESHGIRLEKRGKEYKGICPFHPDKTPSLSVNPDKGVWHCFGCGASGNADTFLSRIQTNTAPASSILNAAADHYSRSLSKHHAALDYLKRRGLGLPWLIESYRIGYGDGSIANTTAKRTTLKADLKNAGVLTDRGRDRFFGYITIPIISDAGEVVGLYGRRVEPDPEREPKHLYLPGPHRGVFNTPAIKRDEPLILCECVIDALTLIANGFRQVTCVYGTQGWTDHHAEIVRSRTIRRAYIAFDGDAAGEKGAAAVAEKLSALGVESLRVEIPTGEDVNSLFTLKSETVDSFRERLTAARPPLKAAAIQKLPPSVEAAPTGFRSEGEEGAILERAGRRYLVRGFNAFGMSRMRVTVRAESADRFHIDTLDLYVSPSRSRFINETSRRFDTPADTIEADLMALIAGLENLRDRRANKKAAVEVKPMTQDAKSRALAFLRNPRLLDEILADMESLGYVREEQNKLLGYLVGVSRKLAEPLSCIVVSRSGAGKSHLLDVIEMLTPPEDVVPLSSLTPQALYYMDRDELAHKLVMIEERSGSEDADYSIRQLQTKKVLRKAVAIKDPITGQIKTARLEVRGPISYAESTTKLDVNPENANRCFVLYVDESKAQTARIQAYQRWLRTREGFAARLRLGEIVSKHHNAQRLLEPVAVFCPFAEYITFPDERLRTRRDHARFLNLIEAVTFLHQHQRTGGVIEVTNDAGEKETRRYVESTLADYEAAYKLAGAILRDNLHDLPHGSRELLALLRDQLAKTPNGKPARRSLGEGGDAPTFRQRDARDWTKWSHDQVKTHLRQLVEMEYVEIVHGTNGNAHVYKLSDVAADPADILAGLPTPEQLFERWEKARNGNGKKPQWFKNNRGEPVDSGVMQQLRAYPLESQDALEPVGAGGRKGSI